MIVAACSACEEPFVDVELFLMPPGDPRKAPLEMQTLVGYIAPPGHSHDDNCRYRTYQCANGHWTKVSKRVGPCKADCTWIGKDRCDCHPGLKVDVWPEVDF